MIEAPFQIALFARLDAAKVALGIVGVFDVAPQPVDGGSSAQFPYVVMGRSFPVQDDTQTSNGFAVTFRVHTFTRSGSMLQCKGIQSGIYQLLHRQPLTVPGFHSFKLLRADTDCVPDQDGKIHGVCEYRGLIQQL